VAELVHLQFQLVSVHADRPSHQYGMARFKIVVGEKECEVSRDDRTLRTYEMKPKGQLWGNPCNGNHVTPWTAAFLNTVAHWHCVQAAAVMMVFGMYVST